MRSRLPWTSRAIVGWLIGTGLGLSISDDLRAQPRPDTTVDELIVTGTRLPAASILAGGPAVSIDRQDLARSHTPTLEGYLNTLPQVVPSFGAAANNPSSNGAAFVDLRGLGESRNLVLLDGRRIVGANASGAVDVNAIPAGLVDRIEITTGGASAVYGADAVAGVVNIILKRDHRGLELQGRTSVTERGDGRQHELDAVWGRTFSRGRLLVAGSVLDRDELGKGARDFTSQAQVQSSFFPTGSYVPAGPNLPSQAAVDALFAGYGSPPGSVPRNGGFGGYGFNDDGTLFSSGFPNNNPFDSQNYRGPVEDLTRGLFPDVYAYNFEPFNKLILPLRRYTGALSGGFEASDRLRLYGQATYARYTARTALAPTPAPTSVNPAAPNLVIPLFVIPASHPLIPADLRRLLDSRVGNTPQLAGVGPDEAFTYRLRTTAFGARETANRVETAHLVAGARIDLDRDWEADVYAAFGRYRLRETQGGLLSVVRLQQLLNSPTAGRDICDGGFDPFGVRVGAGCLDHIRTSATNRTRIRQSNVVLSAAGPLLQLPAGQALLAVGLEARDVRFRLTPQAGIDPGSVAGYNPVLPLSGVLRFRDVFAEASLPLWAGEGARQLDAVVGARLSDDTDGHTARSFKAELSFVAAPSLRFRGSFQQAVRAPNIAEMFEPAVDGFALAVDPCSVDSGLRTDQVLALCQAQGAAIGFPADLVSQFLQGGPGVGAVQGGNADLKAERAHTFTLGLVWRPEAPRPWMLPPSLTLDAYDIDLEGAIGSGDVQVQINACYNIDGSNPAYDPAHPACAVTRSPIDFSLSGLDGRQTNQARIQTRGIDATGTVGVDLAGLLDRAAYGQVELRVLASWIDSFKEQASPLRPTIDFAGTIADAGTGYQSLPRWKGRADLVWRSGDWEAALTGRYVGPMVHRLTRQDAGVNATGVDDATYWDLSMRWNVHPRAELRLGVVNLFDRGPEIYRPATDANTDPSTYDVLGRRYWVSLTVRR